MQKNEYEIYSFEAFERHDYITNLKAQINNLESKLSKMYTEEEMKMNLIYCVSELIANPKGTADEMKIWNERTHEWFNNNKK
jgi:hypothetical protein